MANWLRYVLIVYAIFWPISNTRLFIHADLIQEYCSDQRLHPGLSCKQLYYITKSRQTL